MPTRASGHRQLLYQLAEEKRSEKTDQRSPCKASGTRVWRQGAAGSPGCLWELGDQRLTCLLEKSGLSDQQPKPKKACNLGACEGLCPRNRVGKSSPKYPDLCTCRVRREAREQHPLYWEVAGSYQDVAAFQRLEMPVAEKIPCMAARCRRHGSLARQHGWLWWQLPPGGRGGGAGRRSSTEQS